MKSSARSNLKLSSLSKSRKRRRESRESSKLKLRGRDSKRSPFNRNSRDSIKSKERRQTLSVSKRLLRLNRKGRFNWR